MTATTNPPNDSTVSRAVFRLDVVMCSLFVAGGTFMFWSLTWGPHQWHSGPSLVLVAGLGLSWPVIGIAWLLYAALIGNHRTRVLGYWLGVVLTGFFCSSLLSATFAGRLTSVYALVLVIFATMGQVSGAVRSMVTAERKR